MILDENIVGTAVICDSAGRIVSVARDDLGIADKSLLGRPLHDVVDAASAEKADLFLKEVGSRGAAFQWPITVLLGNELVLLHFMGAACGDQILVVATRSPGVLVRFYEEMSRINNEQINLVRAAVIEAANKAEAGPTQNAAAFEEMAELNNELANMQRESAQQNSELVRLNNELMIARGLLEKKQTELERANGQLAALATQDGLTGIHNRRSFDERMTAEFQRAERYGLALSLLMCDVDKFKSFNDTYGHPAGDDVLRTVGAVLKASARTSDFVARYGGEEFVAILVESDAAAARATGERIRKAIESQVWSHRAVTASIGLATLSSDILDAATLMGQADQALYHSKERGRNCVTHHCDIAKVTTATEVPGDGTVVT